MRIGELAKKTGCKVVTIRYYEKEGLLAEPNRTGGNYRSYSGDDLDRLEFIMHCRKHGMKLEEIRNLLAFKDRPRKDCSWIGELISTHITEVEEKIRSLEHLKFHLEELRQRCLCGDSGGNCGILRSLDGQAECCSGCERCGTAGTRTPSR